MRIVRPGTRLGMVLHAEHRIAPVLQPCARLVVQVHMRHRDTLFASSVSGSTAKLWFCDVISTLSVSMFLIG